MYSRLYFLWLPIISIYQPSLPTTYQPLSTTINDDQRWSTVINHDHHDHQPVSPWSLGGVAWKLRSPRGHLQQEVLHHLGTAHGHSQTLNSTSWAALRLVVVVMGNRWGWCCWWLMLMMNEWWLMINGQWLKMNDSWLMINDQWWMWCRYS